MTCDNYELKIKLHYHDFKSHKNPLYQKMGSIGFLTLCGAHDAVDKRYRELAQPAVGEYLADKMHR